MQQTRFRVPANCLVAAALLLCAAALLIRVEPLVAQEDAEATEVPAPQATEDARITLPDAAATTGGHFGQNCGECHLDFRAAWATGAHAIAFDRPSFQQYWAAARNDPNCLECHVTLFEPATGRFLRENVHCEACHGLNPDNHPPAPVQVRTEANMCGNCHESTFAEWRRSLHAFNDDLGAVGCAVCHNPHGQQIRFETTNDLCLNCHKNNPEVTHEYAYSYVHLTHNEVNFEGVEVTCASCHMHKSPSDESHNLSNHTMNVTTVPCTECHDAISVLGTSPLIVPIDAALAQQRDALERQVRELEAELEAARAVQQPPGTNFIQLTQGLIIGLGVGATLFLVLRQRNNGRSRRADVDASSKSSEE